MANHTGELLPPWERVCECARLRTERIRVHDGWIYRCVQMDDVKDLAICVALVFVPEKHGNGDG